MVNLFLPPCTIINGWSMRMIYSSSYTIYSIITGIGWPLLSIEWIETDRLTDQSIQWLNYPSFDLWLPLKSGAINRLTRLWPLKKIMMKMAINWTHLREKKLRFPQLLLKSNVWLQCLAHQRSLLHKTDLLLRFWKPFTSPGEEFACNYTVYPEWRPASLQYN